jgi:hypothetical protein
MSHRSLALHSQRRSTGDSCLVYRLLIPDSRSWISAEGIPQSVRLRSEPALNIIEETSFDFCDLIFDIKKALWVTLGFRIKYS